jgi:hypothetical protein
MKLFLLGLLFSLSAQAVEVEVITLKGSATYNGQTLAQNQTLNAPGELAVGDKSYLKLKYKDNGTTVAFAANSSVKLSLDKVAEAQNVNLLKGYARWMTGKEGVKNPNAGITTKNASMGVRGTNFMAFYNSDLGESEIWVFDGLVEFGNRKNRADFKRVSKNQWGGIGGRFGQKCQDILTLSPELINKVGSILPEKL